jgi:hypothetical protein
MPKLIDYPRTTYAGAWELAEIVDDTGGKCAVDTAARKQNRKVSGSFKAIIGSAVKFGLLTSKRELLSTTTLFRRIKHAYDKQEELLFHREAFLTPPLFTQICRKFRSRELPLQMLDVILIREFAVEEINALGVAKAFIEGARMVGILDEHNTVADIDQLAAQPPPRRELSNPQPSLNTFRPTPPSLSEELFDADDEPAEASVASPIPTPVTPFRSISPATPPSSLNQDSDAIANLFGLATGTSGPPKPTPANLPPDAKAPGPAVAPIAPLARPTSPSPTVAPTNSFRIQVSGPGLDTSLTIDDEDDLALVTALLEKIRRQLRS